MKRKRFLIQIIVSLCILLIASLLIFGCLNHVFSAGSDGDMYSLSSVQAHFRAFGWVYAGLIAVVSALSLTALFMKKPSARFERAKEYKRNKEMSARTKTIVRLGAVAVSAVLIVLGIVNGGLRDVFVKAVNICTECIGLG